MSETRKIAAILGADVVGYSRLVERMHVVAALRAVQRSDRSRHPRAQAVAVCDLSAGTNQKSSRSTGGTNEAQQTVRKRGARG
jgi:hypothetical protein